MRRLWEAVNISEFESSNFTASDILLKAASRIEEEGMWCQGSFWPGLKEKDTTKAFALAQSRRVRVPECALGALIGAAIDLGLGYMDFADARWKLEAAAGDIGVNGAAIFNDATGRTADEVADLMRRAAT